MKSTSLRKQPIQKSIFYLQYCSLDQPISAFFVLFFHYFFSELFFMAKEDSDIQAPSKYLAPGFFSNWFSREVYKAE